jgi:hypothetical protein
VPGHRQLPVLPPLPLLRFHSTETNLSSYSHQPPVPHSAGCEIQKRKQKREDGLAHVGVERVERHASGSGGLLPDDDAGAPPDVQRQRSA